MQRWRIKYETTESGNDMLTIDHEVLQHLLTVGGKSTCA